MKWFHWDQNNSGGSFVINDNVAPNVYIQAPNYAMADGQARSIGIYYDGCSDGIDCDCCGDRWCGGDEVSEPFTYHGPKKDSQTFDNIEDYVRARHIKWAWAGKNKPEAWLYYADGRKVGIYLTSGT